MAIGRVGSFATVEPALVDFGSMAERNIDKIKAEEEAKKVAKAKEEQAKRDAVKDIKDPNIQKTIGIGAVDEGISRAMRGEFEKFADYKSIGDADNAGRSARKMNIVAQQSEYLQKKMADYEAAIKTVDDINPEAYRGVMNFLTNLDKDKVKISFEGDDPTISVMNEDGTYPEPSNLVDYVQNVLTPVRNYVEIDDIKKVTDTIKASTTESGSYALNTKITDINSKESAPQVNELRRQAKLRTSLDESMFNWYNNQRAQNNKLPFKVSGWTDEEKKQAEDYYFNTFKDSYNREVEKGFGSPGGGSGGGPKETPSIPSIVEPVVAGTVGFNDSVDKLFRNGGYTRPIFKGDKGNVKISGLELTNIMVNKNGNIVFVLEQPVGSSTGLGGASETNKEGGNTYLTASDKGFRIAREKAKNLLGLKTDKELASWVSGGELKFNSNNNNNNNRSEAQQRGL
jgi:hypothetical protein